MSICVICSAEFSARHAYGLCPTCFSKDAARELDRLDSARHKACKNGVKFTLTLREWLGAISDFRGLCAFCQEYTYSIIEMVEPARGLVYDNTAPCCKSCSHHRRYGFDVAEDRVRWYLSSEKEQHETPQNEEEHG